MLTDLELHCHGALGLLERGLSFLYLLQANMELVGVLFLLLKHCFKLLDFALVGSALLLVLFCSCYKHMLREK